MWEDLVKDLDLPMKHRLGKWAVGALAGIIATLLAEKAYSLWIEPSRDSSSSE